MELHRRLLSTFGLATVIPILLLTACSPPGYDATCKKVKDLESTLINRANSSWEAADPKNGGDGDFSKFDVLAADADRLIVNNPGCFSKGEISEAAKWLGEDIGKQGTSTNSIFDKPAQGYLLPSGINSLLAVWGIPLNDDSGPRNLGEVSDDIIDYLNSNSRNPAGPTKDQLLISLQPGNSVHSMVHRLFIDSDVIDAVVNRWLTRMSN